MKRVFWILANLAIITGFTPVVMAQQTAKFLASESSMEIKGTSNLHEWEERVKSFNVTLDVVYGNNTVQGFNNVVFSSASTAIESDNSIMTNKTQEALNVKKYPEIRFTQTSKGVLQNQNGKLTGTIEGNLELAGVRKLITLSFEGKVESGKLSISGSEKIKMSDFNISAPTALLGSLKTGDEVELIYLLQFAVN